MVAIVLQFLRENNLKAKIAWLKFKKFAKLRYARLVNSIYIGAIALAVFAGLGILLGYLGYQTEVGWFIGLGQFLIALGGMLATGMLCLFYLKAGVIGTHSLHAFDGLLEFITGGKVKNFFSKEVGANIRNDLLNAFAWVAAFCLWCDFVPVWKFPIALPIGATLAAFFAFASARSWTFVEKPIGKAVVFAFLAMMFIANTVNVFTVGAISEWSAAKGEFVGSYIRNNSADSLGQREILDARRDFVRETAKARLREYQRLAKRQIKIMLMPSNERNNVKIKREFTKNASRMVELEGEARRVKRASKQNGLPTPVPAANISPPNNRNGSASQAGDWFNANWGWILLTVLVLGLCVLSCIGFATKEKWLAGTATILLILLALIGSLVWIAKKVDMREFSYPNIPPAQIRLQTPFRTAGTNLDGERPATAPVTIPNSFSRIRTDVPPPPPARGLRQALDSIVPEEPGEWR